MMQQKLPINYLHKRQYCFEITQKVSFCFNCSSAIITDKLGNEITTIKPLKYHVPQETALPIFLNFSDIHKPYIFFNKSSYLKIRTSIVQKMKQFCNFFKLTKKTFFLALDYLDRICSKMMNFDLEDIKQISQLCIILASKYQENGVKGMEVKKLSCGVSTNYSDDELYLLQLLNYDLHCFTCYDIIMDLLHTGFLFNDEKFSIKKMHLIYGKIENMLYLFSESKYYIDWTHKEIALGIIGLIRETLGLVAFSNNIQTVCMNEYANIYNYLGCLNRLRKCFKFKVDDNNHSDSTDSNSDNNSDNLSENNSDKFSNKLENKFITNKIQEKENTKIF